MPPRTTRGSGAWSGNAWLEVLLGESLARTVTARGPRTKCRKSVAIPAYARRRSPRGAATAPRAGLLAVLFGERVAVADHARELPRAAVVLPDVHELRSFGELVGLARDDRV